MKLYALLLSVHLLYVILQTVSSKLIWKHHTHHNALDDDWTHHLVLDDGGIYHVYWNPPEDKEGDSEIVFRVVVQAKGYVGFGFSPDGSMNGSDIVTGWVKNGKEFFQDRHGIGDKMPPKDKKQDWILMHATENKSHTILQFRRRLNTRDCEDMIIDESTMRVMYAFSDRDPCGEDPIYRNRGSKSVMLLDSRKNTRPIPYEDSLLHWDLMHTNIDISHDDTIYWCQIFKSPSLSKKHHIVKGSPLIKKGNEHSTHHAMVFECKGLLALEKFEAELKTPGYNCHNPDRPDVYRMCDGITMGWAIGSEGPVYPEHVGVPLGPNPQKYYMLQAHYDNVQLTEKVIDYFGFRIYYTPHLRKHDAGSFFIGSIVGTPRMFIPPGQEKFLVNGHSNPDCLDPVLPEHGIRVFAVFLHTHLLGVGVRTRHFRGKKELRPIADDRNYDRNYQEYRYFNKDVSILSGDQLTTECTYSSSGRTNVTFGGYSTREEMCFTYVMYYPPIQRFRTSSMPTLSTINTALKTNFTDDKSLYSLSDYNWDHVKMEELSKTLMNSRQEALCSAGNRERNEVKSMVSYPENFQPFVRNDGTCNKCGYN